MIGGRKIVNYRILGRTGLKVSELGLGGHEFARFLPSWHFTTNRKFEEPVNDEELLATQGPRNELILKAIEGGVNYFDTGEVAEPQSLGLALKMLGRRKDVYIAAETMGPVRMLKEIPKAKWRDTLIERTEERLKLLNTNHIDVFNAHELFGGYSRDRFEFVMSVLNEIKVQGKIGAIGVSDHQPRFIAELIRKYDCFESVMIPYNYNLQEAREILFPLCRALNIGVVVMKPLNWPYYGLPFMHFRPPGLNTRGYTLPQMSLRWILKSPEVSTIVPGTNTIAELEENLAIFTKEDRIDEEVLKKCLEYARSEKGREKLRKLCDDEEIARKRAYIQGYSKRALTGFAEDH
jgi:aryl-alcohol dehydrogenase-like predicted oxidoreductase